MKGTKKFAFDDFSFGKSLGYTLEVILKLMSEDPPMILNNNLFEDPHHYQICYIVLENLIYFYEWYCISMFIETIDI